MTEEEFFRKTYPDFCYGDRLLSPYWDLFQYGVEFGEQQSEKKIKELELELTVEKDLHQEETNLHLHAEDYIESLEKENERLKGDLELWESGGCRATNLFKCGVAKELKDQLTKAKELLNEFMRISKASDEDFEHDYSELIGETEQFIKDLEK